MSLIQAIVYGIVQGLTEFLPVSSTAHLRIVPALLGWGDPGAAFTAVIQFGTLVAVLLYFARDIGVLTTAALRGVASGKPFQTQESKMAWMIAAGTIPVVIMGVLFKKNIETNLRSLYVIVASMIGLALVLLAAELVERRRVRKGEELKTMEKINWREAILIGCAQAVALIPGASRSGVTITGGLFAGLTRETAARFSFLLSLPSVFAAGMYELIKQRQELMSTDVGVFNLIVATLVSGIVGYASIGFLIGYLKKHTTYIFIVYRIVVGGTILVLAYNGFVA
jgi:undecaprenyl-diphosphatase